MRLIDADALENESIPFETHGGGRFIALGSVRSAPTIDPESLRKKGVWISVEDRLPEKNTSVLVSTDNGIVFQCLYAYDGWDLWVRNAVNITHWMPLPEPPKGE